MAWRRNMIRVKRTYSPASADDGARFLVDRLWPRGIRKQDLAIDAWLQEIAPSGELRKWFGHDPARWEEFVARYHSELDGKQAELEQIRTAAHLGNVMLVYGARDEEHNNAVALRAYLVESWDHEPDM
jgi:uncharacterized protein YeaO (DUF488 family)